MKKLLILFMIFICSRNVNAQQFGTKWDSLWWKADEAKGQWIVLPKETGTATLQMLSTGGIGWADQVTYDTIKCIMLCSDTAAQEVYGLGSLMNGKLTQTRRYVHNHEVFWQSGYEVTTNVWGTHVVYLDDMKKPFPYFVWLSNIAR
jgi:hypothetical protein